MELEHPWKIEPWIVGEEKWNWNVLQVFAELPLIAVVQRCAIF